MAEEYAGAVTMPRVAKRNDRVFFAFCAAAGALILLGSALPTFELYLDASIGGGDSQRVFEYHRDLHLLTYAEPGGLVFPLSGAALLVIGIAGALRPRGWLVVAAAVLTVPVFVQTVKTVDYAQSPGDGGVYGCEQPELEACVGYLAPAVRDFRADILRKPEARRPRVPRPGTLVLQHRASRRLAARRLVGGALQPRGLVPGDAARRPEAALRGAPLRRAVGPDRGSRARVVAPGLRVIAGASHDPARARA